MKFISTAYVTLAVCFCDNVITFPDKNASAAVIDKWTHNGTIFSGYLYQSVCNDITIGENLAKKLKTILQSFSYLILNGIYFKRMSYIFHNKNLLCFKIPINRSNFETPFLNFIIVYNLVKYKETDFNN